MDGLESLLFYEIVVSLRTVLSCPAIGTQTPSRDLATQSPAIAPMLAVLLLRLFLEAEGSRFWEEFPTGTVLAFEGGHTGTLTAL